MCRIVSLNVFAKTEEIHNEFQNKKENTVIVEPTCKQLETFASPGQFGELELTVLLNFHLPKLVFSTTFGTNCVTIVHKKDTLSTKYLDFTMPQRSRE